jgi:hypothetical protein
MRYLLVTGPVISKTPDAVRKVYIEDGSKIEMHSEDPEGDEKFPEDMEAMKIRKLEDIIQSGHSYYNTEIGQYEGADKVRIDKLIASLADEQEA